MHHTRCEAHTLFTKLVLLLLPLHVVHGSSQRARYYSYLGTTTALAEPSTVQTRAD